MAGKFFRPTLSLVLIVSFLFLAIRSLYSFPIYSDETIYINMAKSVSMGLVPYKDFFYAHPPLQLLLLQIPIIFNDFSAVKILVTLFSIGSAVLVYLIAKEIFSEKAGFFAFLFFLLFPGFILLSNQAMGIFEALFFFLAGFYFLVRKKTDLAAVLIAVSVFTRYMALILVPFVIYYIYKYQKKDLQKFAKYLAISLSGFAGLSALIFGQDFFIDTLVYHTQANLSVNSSLAAWLDQYLLLGFFTTFLSMVAISYSYTKKDWKIAAFATFPVIYDLLVLFSFKTVIYHYFVLASPFVFIAAGAVFEKSRDFIIRMILAAIIAFSIIANMHSILFFFSQQNHEIFPELITYTKNNLGKNATIFGEPRTINYISFVTGSKIANNFLDSDPKFINFEGHDFYEKVSKADPEIIIIDNKYNKISNFQGNYSKIKEWEIHDYYSIALYKKA